MNPFLDHLFVGLALLGAVIFFARRIFNRHKSCGGGCCDTSKKRGPLPR